MKPVKKSFKNLLDIMPAGFPNLHEYQRCYENKQFDHLTKPYEIDFEGEGDKAKYIPEKKRKPSFVASIGKQIAETVVSHTFGQDNFPQIIAKSGEDIDDEAALSLQEFVNTVAKRTYLNSEILCAARKAVSQARSVVLMKLVKGKPCFETINYKWITDIQFDPEDNKTILSLEETKLVQDAMDGEWYWNRRTIDAYSEIRYAPVIYDESDHELPKFTVKEYESIYDLEYCPAWLLENVDGVSIYEGQMENIIEYSYLVTAILVGTKKNMNPQRIHMGDEPLSGDFVRSNDTVWSMPPGKFISDAPNPQSFLYAQQEEARIRELILRGCRVIEIPDANYQSGDALKIKLAPEVNLVQETRVELGDKGMAGMLHLMCCYIIDLNQPGKTVTTILYGPKKVEKTFAPAIKLGAGVVIPDNHDFEIELGWGEIFSSTANTRNLEVQTMALATNAENSEDPLFSKYSTRKFLARSIKVNDLNAEQAQIETERIRRHLNLIISSAIESAANMGDLSFLGALADKMVKGEDEEKLVTFIHEYGEERKRTDAAIIAGIKEEEKEEDDDDSSSPSASGDAADQDE